MSLVCVRNTTNQPQTYLFDHQTFCVRVGQCHCHPNGTCLAVRIPARGTFEFRDASFLRARSIQRAFARQELVIVSTQPALGVPHPMKTPIAADQPKPRKRKKRKAAPK